MGLVGEKLNQVIFRSLFWFRFFSTAIRKWRFASTFFSVNIDLVSKCDTSSLTPILLGLRQAKHLCSSDFAKARISRMFLQVFIAHGIRTHDELFFSFKNMGLFWKHVTFDFFFKHFFFFFAFIILIISGLSIFLCTAAWLHSSDMCNFKRSLCM